jgi:hypothetical protein
VTDIEKLETLRAAATPGEWREVRGEIWGEELFAQYAVVAPTNDCACRFEHGNASWLTAIHNAAPALIAEVRRLRAIEAAARRIEDEHFERDGLWITMPIQWKHWDELRAALAAKENEK